MRRVDLYHARWDTAGFHGFIDGGKNNVAVARDVNDDAAAGKIGDDLIFRRLRLCSRPRVQARDRRNECETASKPGGTPRMIVMIHSSYIVRPDAIEPIPGIMKRQRISARLNIGIGAPARFPVASVSSRIDAANTGDGEKIMGLRKAKSIRHNGKTLAEILAAHARFFQGKDDGARADLTDADVSRADLSGVNLSGAILRNANLEGTDLRRSKLPGADLSGANLRQADLRNADLTEAILPGADLTEAQASGIEFFRCDLSNANFQRAQLRNVNMRGANVKGAKFAGADLGVAILRETDLSGADLSGVDLSTTLMPKGWAPQSKQKSA